jgi:hypothetical protein
MATRIHAVHRDQAGGAITRVKLSEDSAAAKDAAKAAVVALIRSGESVMTAPPGGGGSRVLVVDGLKPVLKTARGGTEADNLGGLPTY